MKITSEITKNVTNYYEDKLRRYGPTPLGVDWNSPESQELRFKQVLKVVDVGDKGFTLLDYGCGVGSLCGYMKKNYRNFSYTGFDLSTEMVEQAKKLYPDLKIKWINNIGKLERFDYVVASGIFNVRLNFSEEEWLKYVLETLKQLHNLSLLGFAFNILTKYSDKEFMKNTLFYADPCFFFDYCKRNFSKKVSLLHDYPLYEFTITVRK